MSIPGEAYEIVKPTVGDTVLRIHKTLRTNEFSLET